MTQRFTVEISSSGATAILRCHPGTVYFDEIDDVPGVVADLVRGGCRAIILNLDGLQFAGNRPLGVLAHAHAICRKADVSLVLCGVEPRAREILRITKLDRVLELCVSEAAAIRAVQSSPPAAPDRAEAEDRQGYAPPKIGE